MSAHTVTIDYGTGAPFPTLSFRCNAPAGEPCHAYYECSCEEWEREGVVHGKPFHIDSGDETHFGYWRNDECRLQDWFENSDEAVVGSVSVPVTAKYTGGWYEFDITAAVAS